MEKSPQLFQTTFGVGFNKYRVGEAVYGPLKVALSLVNLAPELIKASETGNSNAFLIALMDPQTQNAILVERPGFVLDEFALTFPEGLLKAQGEISLGLPSETRTVETFGNGPLIPEVSGSFECAVSKAVLMDLTEKWVRKHQKATKLSPLSEQGQILPSANNSLSNATTIDPESNKPKTEIEPKLATQLLVDGWVKQGLILEKKEEPTYTLEVRFKNKAILLNGAPFDPATLSKETFLPPTAPIEATAPASSKEATLVLPESTPTPDVTLGPTKIAPSEPKPPSSAAKVSHLPSETQPVESSREALSS